MTPGGHDAAQIAARVRLACEWEVRARKVGNVHPGRRFADMGVADFLLSAQAVEAAFRRQLEADATVGGLVHAAVHATRQVVAVNTNLGIVLLLAPLALASSPRDVGRVLRQLTLRDSVQVYAAIRLAAPGGLGRAAEQDVNTEPTVTLLEVMRLAAGRDAVARQYVTDYADIREVGLPALLAGLAEYGCGEAAIVQCHLELLAHLPDTLIARKRGPAVAEEVRSRAAAVVAAGGLRRAAGRRLGRELDAFLRSDGHRLNPGATADLACACVYWALADGTLPADAPFAWLVPDWI